MAPNSPARVRRAPTRPSSVSRPTRDRTDPLAPPLRACWPPGWGLVRPPRRRIRWCGRQRRASAARYGVIAKHAALKLRARYAVTRSRRILARAREGAALMMALAARRELGGGVRQHPGSNNCVEGAYGIARFDRREPVESDEHARSTCGVRELRQPPVRRSEGQRAAAARRPTSIVCWWRPFVGGERAMLAAPSPSGPTCSRPGSY
jgi:hypothetical protein